jgi:hypothetical protein
VVGHLGCFHNLAIVNTTLGDIPKKCDPGYSRGTCTPMFIAALIYMFNAITIKIPMIFITDIEK